jgi:hypothetical protein
LNLDDVLPPPFAAGELARSRRIHPAFSAGPLCIAIAAVD